MLLMPIVAYAEPCQDIEYAELENMSQASLENKYCNVEQEVSAKLNIWKKEKTAIAWQNMDSCNDLSKKITRVYKKRFKNGSLICFKNKTKK